MPFFSKMSLLRLSTCDIRLQNICNEVIKIYDFSVICGHRGKVEQQKAYRTGGSKLQYPDSKHNSLPSLAVDLAPYNKGIDWSNIDAFEELNKLMQTEASKQGVKLRWGGDWDGDGSSLDERFLDRPHWEIKE